ncbi:zinc finger CCCH domain-containing protein 6 [Curcuma longa]|uniref:zinc finger CCCH domain-containing protein 6 n=1 Tax=Curcuma longa TaxID=136217 RepID=UPI003D9E56E1
MAGLKQSKRVSWARELNQVRLFLAEDAPALSGLGTQDNLQAKGSWLLHASSISNDDSSLPPGFESPHPAYQFRSEIAQIPLVKWRCPLRILLNPKWLVAAGAESEEVTVQNQRQVRVLEAIYPRSTSIPPNPSVSSEVQDSFCNDSQTPTIPITAVEDEDPSEQLETDPGYSQFQETTARNLQGSIRQQDIQDHTLDAERSQVLALQSALTMSQGDTTAARILGSAEPDVVAAASAAFTAIMKSNEQGSMIDRDLLINILTNPSLVEKLVSEYGASREAQPALASSSTPFSHSSLPIQSSAHPPAPPPGLPPMSNNAPPLPVYRTSQMYSLPSSVPPPVMNAHAVPSIPIPLKPMPGAQVVVRDANYLKSLVQQHGGEKQDTSSYHNNMVAGNVDLLNGSSHQREARPKIPRPCAFFNTPKGCRHGANCSYQHDPSLPPRTQQQPRGSNKRIKLDGGIVYRN